MNSSLFGKTLENVGKHRDIRLVTADRKRSRLVAEPNYHTTKYWYILVLILDKSQIVMYEYWCDFAKPKYGDKP